MNESGLFINQSEGMLRIVIHPGRRERGWLAVAATTILIFGLLMSGLAAFSLKHTGIAGRLWWLPLIFTALIVLLYGLSLAVIGAIPPTVVAYDGRELAIGDELDERRTVLSRGSIKSVRVSRLPLAPIGTMMIRSKGQPPARAGYWRNKELMAAADRLRAAMGLAK